MAFIRVQNGVYDPVIIGDKHKWFSHQLDTIDFSVWNKDNSTLEKLFTDFQNRDTDSENDEVEEEDSGDISTSSSYSSLNEFVEEMFNANRMNAQFLGKFYIERKSFYQQIH